MTNIQLRLIEDLIPAGATHIYLPQASRAIYVVEGGLTIEFTDGAQHTTAESAWLGSDEITLINGAQDTRIWRWELYDGAQPLGVDLPSAPGTKSICKLTQELELDRRFEWLMRCDRVGFPPGGVALTHVHQGPGIRCVLHGEIIIETLGQSHTHSAGDAWFELGHAPVLAPTTQETSTTFIRCFILPRACRGKSSIRYVRSEDATKPKSQHYHIFGERFIQLN